MSEVYKQIETEEGITHYRKVRGDGNCYYRAVGYAYIEKLVMTRNYNGL